MPRVIAELVCKRSFLQTMFATCLQMQDEGARGDIWQMNRAGVAVREVFRVSNPAPNSIFRSFAFGNAPLFVVISFLQFF